MFGLLFTAASAIAYGISGAKMKMEDSMLKADAEKKAANGKNRSNTYTDHRGSTRDIKTNQLRFQSFDERGDVWLSDIHGNRLRNLSKEKRDEAFEEAKRKADPTTRAVKYDNWTRKNIRKRLNHDMDVLTGDVYRDVRNNDLYFERKYIEWNKDTLYSMQLSDTLKTSRCCAHFYMRVSNGMLVGLSDRKQPDDNKPTEEEVQRFIEFFNQKQREGGWDTAYGRENGWKSCQETSVSEFYLIKNK